MFPVPHTLKMSYEISKFSSDFPYSWPFNTFSMLKGEKWLTKTVKKKKMWIPTLKKTNLYKFTKYSFFLNAYIKSHQQNAWILLTANNRILYCLLFSSLCGHSRHTKSEKLKEGNVLPQTKTLWCAHREDINNTKLTSHKLSCASLSYRCDNTAKKTV